MNLYYLRWWVSTRDRKISCQVSSLPHQDGGVRQAAEHRLCLRTFPRLVAPEIQGLGEHAGAWKWNLACRPFFKKVNCLAVFIKQEILLYFSAFLGKLRSPGNTRLLEGRAWLLLSRCFCCPLSWYMCLLACQGCQPALGFLLRPKARRLNVWEVHVLCFFAAYHLLLCLFHKLVWVKAHRFQV